MKTIVGRKNVLKLWVAALRSGKYKKCKGELRKGNKFCVLGVLCDLHRKHGPIKDRAKWAKEDGGNSYSYGDLFFSAPRCAEKWASINCYGELSYNNDDDGSSFKQLAKKIERMI